MMDEEEKTRCIGTVTLTLGGLPSGWTVHRVKTRSSTYTLGLYTKPGERRVAVLRGRSAGMGQDISAMDSDPRIGDESLFDVPVAAWVGKPLTIGTIGTSPVASVEKENDPAEVTGVVRALSTSSLAPRAATEARASSRPPDVSRYPLNYVEGLENMAAWLRRMANQPHIMEDIAERSAWTQRVRIALVNARQALEDIARDEHLR